MAHKLYHEAKGSDAQLIISVFIKNGKGVFEGLKSLVDVGGCTGIVAKAVSKAYPELKCSVFDLPHVVEGLEGGNNMNYIGGDMFKSVPSAHAILLKEHGKFFCGCLVLPIKGECLYSSS
ncbi:hypothetical protein AABB24_032988 [Solanum stoloniferum]|uniref:O-methyltransferase C-terminal domain-containing protein n=1 Tax=Solanum stoloniferum TaxID=62892 RepID=A0ABD2RM20_9SOLN